MDDPPPKPTTACASAARAAAAAASTASASGSAVMASKIATCRPAACRLSRAPRSNCNARMPGSVTNRTTSPERAIPASISIWPSCPAPPRIWRIDAVVLKLKSLMGALIPSVIPLTVGAAIPQGKRPARKSRCRLVQLGTNKRFRGLCLQSLSTSHRVWATSPQARGQPASAPAGPRHALRPTAKIGTQQSRAVVVQGGY